MISFQMKPCKNLQTVTARLLLFHWPHLLILKNQNSKNTTIKSPLKQLFLQGTATRKILHCLIQYPIHLTD